MTEVFKMESPRTSLRWGLYISFKKEDESRQLQFLRLLMEHSEYPDRGWERTQRTMEGRDYCKNLNTYYIETVKEESMNKFLAELETFYPATEWGRLLEGTFETDAYFEYCKNLEGVKQVSKEWQLFKKGDIIVTSKDAMIETKSESGKISYFPNSGVAPPLNYDCELRLTDRPYKKLKEDETTKVFSVE